MWEFIVKDLRVFIGDLKRSADGTVSSVKPGMPSWT